MKKDWIIAFGHILSQLAETKANVRQFGTEDDVRKIYEMMEGVEEEVTKLFDAKVKEWEAFE